MPRFIVSESASAVEILSRLSQLCDRSRGDDTSCRRRPSFRPSAEGSQRTLTDRTAAAAGNGAVAHDHLLGVQYAAITVGKGPGAHGRARAFVDRSISRVGCPDGTIKPENSHLRDKPVGFPRGLGQVIRLGGDEGILAACASGARAG